MQAHPTGKMQDETGGATCLSPPELFIQPQLRVDNSKFVQPLHARSGGLQRPDFPREPQKKRGPDLSPHLECSLFDRLVALELTKPGPHPRLEHHQPLRIFHREVPGKGTWRVVCGRDLSHCHHHPPAGPGHLGSSDKRKSLVCRGDAGHLRDRISEAALLRLRQLLTSMCCHLPAMDSPYPGTLFLSNLYYFMLASTSCYVLKFPKSSRRRKSFLIKRAGELVCLTFPITSLIPQCIIPTVLNSMGHLSEMKYPKCLERLLNLDMPGVLHGLLEFRHLLLLLENLERFCPSVGRRPRLHAHDACCVRRIRVGVAPTMRNNYSKTSAVTLVFFVSAFFHEYLVSVPLVMFRLWAYNGMMTQIPLSQTTISKTDKQDDVFICCLY